MLVIVLWSGFIFQIWFLVLELWHLCKIYAFNMAAHKGFTRGKCKLLYYLLNCFAVTWVVILYQPSSLNSPNLWWELSSYLAGSKFVCVSYSVVSFSLWPHGLRPARLLSVHGILQARILEWVVIPFSRE